MSIKGVLLEPVIEECPYLEGLISINENLLVNEMDDEDFELLLSFGFRHFGEVFFRPMCRHCRCCISIRIPVQQFSLTRSVKRLFNRNKHFTVTLGDPVPSQKTFGLYNHHKEKFSRRFKESYEAYVKSLFHPFSFNRMLSIADGDHLVAVSHLDITANAMSAVYCYYDMSYHRFSPGKFAVYKEIEMAKEMGIKWLYLGYYIPQNRHTKYKIQFKPNQLMTDDYKWIDFLDAKGIVITPYRFPTPPLLF
jgi:leucyl-tRNA---protein transferase